MQLSMHLPISFPKEAYEYGRRSSGETHGVVARDQAVRTKSVQPAISTEVLLNRVPTALSRSFARRW
jgi:hypothetical protein